MPRAQQTGGHGSSVVRKTWSHTSFRERMAAFLPVFVCLSCSVLPMQAYVLSKVSYSESECLPLKQLISDSITAAGISFFADRPRAKQTFDPNEVEPFTPSRLFRHYYGDEASCVEFTKAILMISYSAAEKSDTPVDRNEQRRNLYEYIKAGSYEYAREKLGRLFRNLVEEYVKSSDLWLKNHCVENAALDNVLEAVEVECYRIRNEVGDVKFGNLMALGVGATLAFAIDDTGSMSGEIEAAKKRAQAIVEYTRGTLDAPQNFVLSPFNDPEVGPLTVTNDAVEYHNALGRLSAHGGGDAPELALRGIQLAIENSRPGSIIYVITDVDAKDYILQDTVVAQARQKSIVVTFLLTDQISTCANARRTGRYKTCMRLYKHIAKETGGKVLVLGRSDIFRATDIVQAYAKQGIALLKQVIINGNLREPHRRIRFHADNTLQEILLEAQGACENVYLSSPGSHEEHVKLKEHRYGDIWTTTVDLKTMAGKLLFGQWIFGLDVRAESCTVKIQAKTILGYVFTLFSRSKDDSESEFKLMQEDPFIDDAVAVVLDGYGLTRTEEGRSDHATSLKCVNEYGKILRTIPIKDAKQTTSHLFRNDVLQMKPFRMMVEGQDHEGHPFQRMHPRLITPSHVQIKCDLSDLIFVSGVEAHANITIANFGANDEFVLTTADEHGASKFHDGGKNQNLKIRNRELVTKKMIFFVHEKTKDGTAIKITITAKGTLPGSFQYSSCTLVVGQKKRPRIDSFSVKGTINSRFAETVITSVVTNNADVGREAEFDVLLPHESFITAVRIELANETIHGVIEEKKKAEKIYEEAKQRGTVASHVAAKEKSTRSFRTSMFVEARQKIKFVLIYQQLLKRVLGRYEYAVILSPNQPIRSLTIDLHILEDSALNSLRVPPLKTTQANAVDATPRGTTITYSRHNTAAHVHYQPDYEEQTKWSPKGLSGTFLVEYDVGRPELAGQISVNNGYFAHFFGPPQLQPIPKLVVFIMDTSGSMYGYKMKQLKEAMTLTLQSLRPGDEFDVIAFGEEAISWANGTLLPATESNRNKAVDFVQNLKPFGGTNVEDAFKLFVATMAPYLPNLEVEEESSGGEGSAVIPRLRRATILTEDDELPRDGAEEDLILEDATEPDEELDTFAENYAKMAIFLTDGRPSLGETDTKKLRKTIMDMNSERFLLHTVGLGSLVDFDFLKKLANDNNGTSRRIFEGIDASIQIRNFLEEITNPILRDVVIDYPMKEVTDLTSNEFSFFLGGSELVVAGKVRPDVKKPVSNISNPELLDKGLSAPYSGFLISAQVSGKAFEDVFETELDLDTRKESKIKESPHMIQNFTEKLWAFLRLKDVLLQASVSENKTRKDELNQEALNMSIRYKFVTPLTSMIVVRPDEKVAIENDLKKQEEEAKRTTSTTPFVLTTTPPYLYETAIRRHEEYDDALYYIEHEYDSVDVMEAPEPTSHLSSLSRTVSHPSIRHRKIAYRFGERSRGGGGGGGFSGDPHFIIPVQPDMNICFNWDGKEGEIYNLLYDPEKSIVVNGILENSHAPPTSERVRRTYVSTLGVVLPRQGKKIKITPWNVTIEERSLVHFTLPVSSRASLVSDGGFTISIEPISHSTSEVIIDCQGLVFMITLRRRTHGPYHRDHLDFGLSNDLRSLSRESDGVFGQFASLFTYTEESSKISLIGKPSGSDGQIRNELFIRGKSIPVVKRTMLLPGTEEKATCWYLHKNGVESMRKQKVQFRQSSLFGMPSIM